MTAWCLWNTVIEIFCFIIQILLGHHRVFSEIWKKTLLCCSLKDLGGSSLSLFSFDTFNSGPTTHDTCPSDNRVEHYSVWVNNHIFKNDGIFYSSTIADLNLRSDSHIWAYFSSWMDFSRRVNTHDTFDLMRIQIFGFGQNHCIYRLVIVHVEFLSLKKFIDVVDA